MALYNLTDKHRILAAIYLFFSILFTYLHFIKTYPEHTEAFILSLVIVVVLFTAMLVLLFQVSVRQRESSILLLKDHILQMEQQSNEQIEAFKHDYKNLLLILKGYLTNGELQEADQFLANLLEYSDFVLQPNIYAELANVAIPEVQNLLYSLIGKAESQQIKICLTVVGKLTGVRMNVLDYVRCLSIILNNAVEACEEEATKEIDVRLEVKQQQVQFRVVNYTSKHISLQEIAQKGYSTKAHHSGKGLAILFDLADKNDGTVYLDHAKEQFSVTFSVAAG